MASVRKRKWTHKGVEKEAWVVAYTDQGGKRRIKTFEKKKDADSYRTKVEIEIERGLHVAASATVTIKEAGEAWLNDCCRRRRVKDQMAGTTINVYGAYLKNHIIPEFGRTLVRDLRAIDVQDFINKKREQYAWRSTRTILIVIRQIIAFSIRREWLMVDPLTGRNVRVPGDDRIERRIPSKDELRRILLVVSKRSPYEHEITWRNRMAIVTLAMFGGLRRGEIYGLQWENVDLATGLINIRHSLSYYDGLKDPKTKAGVRTIPMSPPVRRVLELLLQHIEGEPKGFVIRSKRGLPLGVTHNNSRIWQPIMKEAGLVNEAGTPKYGFHSLRHAAVSLLIEQGLDAFILKGIIGHSSVKMTMDVYGHLFPEDQRAVKAIEQVAADFGQTLAPAALPDATKTRQELLTY